MSERWKNITTHSRISTVLVPWLTHIARVINAVWIAGENHYVEPVKYLGLYVCMVQICSHSFPLKVLGPLLCNRLVTHIRGRGMFWQPLIIPLSWQLHWSCHCQRYDLFMLHETITKKTLRPVKSTVSHGRKATSQREQSHQNSK